MTIEQITRAAIAIDLLIFIGLPLLVCVLAARFQPRGMATKLRRYGE